MSHILPYESIYPKYSLILFTTSWDILSLSLNTSHHSLQVWINTALTLLQKRAVLIHIEAKQAN
jgi:hypothetical protein